MKVYLIDPFDREVRVAEHDGSLASIYKLIQHSPMCTVNVNYNGDILYLDDMGRYRNPQAFFKLDTYAQPLAGIGLVVGSTEDGDDAEPYAHIEEIKSRVTWLSNEEAVEMME